LTHRQSVSSTLAADTRLDRKAKAPIATETLQRIAALYGQIVRALTYIGPLLPPAKRGGGKRTVDMREVINGVMYVNRALADVHRQGLIAESSRSSGFLHPQ
jgi:hypothetical protein